MWAVIASATSAAVLFWPPLVVWSLSNRRTARSEAQERERKAYADLIVASIGISRRAHTLLTPLKLRSGQGEGIAVTMGLRQAADPLSIHDWIDRDFGPLIDAWSRVWVYGSAEGVRLGNHLFACCGELMELVGDTTTSTTIRQKSRQLVLGVDIDEQRVEWEQRMRTLAVARRELTEYIRAEQAGHQPNSSPRLKPCHRRSRAGRPRTMADKAPERSR